jgi:hypothetical protein
MKKLKPMSSIKTASLKNPKKKNKRNPKEKDPRELTDQSSIGTENKSPCKPKYLKPLKNFSISPTSKNSEPN